jgi:hypothetical protein
MRIRQDVDARDKPGHDEMAIGASHSLIQHEVICPTGSLRDFVSSPF